MQFEAPHTIFNRQTDLNSRMHFILIKWLIDVFYKFCKVPKPEDYRKFIKALIMLNNVIDKKVIKRQRLQLFGITPFYSTNLIVDMHYVTYICDKAYTSNDVIKCLKNFMEIDNEQHNLCDELSKKSKKDLSKKFLLLLVIGKYNSKEITEFLSLSKEEFDEKFCTPITEKDSDGYNRFVKEIKESIDEPLSNYISKSTYNKEYHLNNINMSKFDLDSDSDSESDSESDSDIEFLGSGTYGSVFYDKSQDVVIKIQKLSINNHYSQGFIITNHCNEGVIAKCDQEQMFTEYLIMKMCEKFNSQNFAKTYGFEIKGGRHVLYNKFEGNGFGDVDLSARDMNIVMIQILHALYLMHNVGIVHNDLHIRNILLLQAEHDNNIKFCSYEFDDFTIYIPAKNLNYIVKICDFGISMKYTEPVVLSEFKDPYMVHNPYRDIDNFVSCFRHSKKGNGKLLLKMKSILGTETKYDEKRTGIDINSLIEELKPDLMKFSARRSTKSKVSVFGGKKIPDEEFKNFLNDYY